MVIKNPPPDLRDIEKYHERFRQYGDIVTITLALDNGKLLECIARKKEVERKLAESVEGTRLLEAERLDYQVHVESSPLWKKIGFALRLYEDTPLLWKQRKYLAAAVSKNKDNPYVCVILSSLSLPCLEVSACLTCPLSFSSRSQMQPSVSHESSASLLFSIQKLRNEHVCKICILDGLSDIISLNLQNLKLSLKEGYSFVASLSSLQVIISKPSPSRIVYGL